MIDQLIGRSERTQASKTERSFLLRETTFHSTVISSGTVEFRVGITMLFNVCMYAGGSMER